MKIETYKRNNSDTEEMMRAEKQREWDIFSQFVDKKVLVFYSKEGSFAGDTTHLREGKIRLNKIIFTKASGMIRSIATFYSKSLNVLWNCRG